MENILNLIKTHSRSIIIIILSIALIISIGINASYYDKEQQLKRSLDQVEKQWNEGIDQLNKGIEDWNKGITNTP